MLFAPLKQNHIQYNSKTIRKFYPIWWYSDLKWVLVLVRPKSWLIHNGWNWKFIQKKKMKRTLEWLPLPTRNSVQRVRIVFNIVDTLTDGIGDCVTVWLYDSQLTTNDSQWMCGVCMCVAHEFRYKWKSGFTLFSITSWHNRWVCVCVYLYQSYLVGMKYSYSFKVRVQYTVPVIVFLRQNPKVYKFALILVALVSFVRDSYLTTSTFVSNQKQSVWKKFFLDSRSSRQFHKITINTEKTKIKRINWKDTNSTISEWNERQFGNWKIII